MKITKVQLRSIIKEELSYVMGEDTMDPTMVGGEDASLTQLATLLGVKGVGADVSQTSDEPTIPYLMKIIDFSKGKMQKAKELIHDSNNRSPEAADIVNRYIGLYLETVDAVQKNVAEAPQTYAKFMEANNLGNAVSSFNHVAKVLGEMKAEAEKVLSLAKQLNSYGSAAVWMTRTTSVGHGEGLVFFRSDKGNVKTVNPEIMMKESGMTRHIEGLKKAIAGAAKGASEQPAAEV
jgi:hypothetical protein